MLQYMCIYTYKQINQVINKALLSSVKIDMIDMIDMIDIERNWFGFTLMSRRCLVKFLKGSLQFTQFTSCSFHGVNGVYQGDVLSRFLSMIC